MSPVLLLLPCILIAAAAAAGLHLFLQLKQELLRESRARQQAIADLDRQIERLRRRPANADSPRFSTVGEFTPASDALVAMPRGTQPVLRADDTAPLKRMQILRRLRDGERPEQIAEALKVPLAQVDLVAQLHQLGVQDMST